MNIFKILFLFNENDKQVKTISPNLIYYLDNVTLAYWVMDSKIKALLGFSLKVKIYIFQKKNLCI